MVSGNHIYRAYLFKDKKRSWIFQVKKKILLSGAWEKICKDTRGRRDDRSRRVYLFYGKEGMDTKECQLYRGCFAVREKDKEDSFAEGSSVLWGKEKLYLQQKGKKACGICV